MVHKADAMVLTAPAPRLWRDTLPVLVNLLRLGQGQFTLAFVVYERPGQRQRLLTDLCQALPDWTFAPLSLQDSALDLRNLSSKFFDTLQDMARRQAPGYDAILLLDWEQRLVPEQPPERQPSTSLVGVFNMGRHLLVQTFGCPCIVFVPQWAMTTLLQLAPDFVSWQSGAFFVPFDVAEVAAAIQAAVLAARTASSQEAATVAQRLDAYLQDVPPAGEHGLPAELVAQGLAAAGTLYLTLHDTARAATLFARLEDWAQQPGLRPWRRRARRGYRQATRGLRRQQHPQVVAEAIPWHIFRGAAALTEAESIYGREEDLRQLLVLLMAPTFRFGTLWGETGCGKTSLVRAGLMPALQKQGYLPIYLNRYEHPAADVPRAIAAAVRGTEYTASLPETLRRTAQMTGKTVMLLCDQFEQVFRQPSSRDQAEHQAFLHTLADCVNDVTLPMRCLLMVRADHLYSLTEFDTLTPLSHPLALDNRYELRWLRQADAARVLHRIQEAAQAVWPEALREAVIADLARDDRVKPVQIQLAAAGLYLRHINTPDDYIQAGRVDGLLKDYLTAIFAPMAQPMLVRRVVRTLASPGNPAVRLAQSVKTIADEVRASETAIQPILDELCRTHVVQARTDTSPLTYELVHDVLAEPALRATTTQELGLSFLRSALMQRRRRLRRREYRIAKRSDITELPETQQRAAQQLLRRTFYTLRIVESVAACVSLFLLVMALQWTTTHVYIESYHPEPLLVRRGLRRLDFLPGFLGPVPLFDTGLTAVEVPSYRRASLEAITLHPWDDASSPRIRRLAEHLEPQAAAQWLFSLGDWQGGVQAMGDLSESGGRRKILYFSGDLVESGPREILDMVRYVIPQESIPSLLSFITKEDIPPVTKKAAVSILGRLGVEQAPAVVPALLPLLRDPDKNVRKATASALEAMGQEQALAVVPALLPLLRDPDKDVLLAAARALGAMGGEQALAVVPALLPLLRDPDTSVRQAAASALGAMGRKQAPAVVPALLPLLRDPNAYVLLAAARALGAIDPEQAPAVIPALLPLLRDPNAYVREEAVDLLGKSWFFLARRQNGQPVYHYLMEQLHSRDSQLNALHRQARIGALARWYHAGRLAEKTGESSQVLEPTDTAELTDVRAQQEHAELHKELSRICFSELRPWLRISAYQVWTGTKRNSWRWR